MRRENNWQIENLCDNLPYLFRIGKAKDKRSLLRCRFNYVSSSLFETCTGSSCYLTNTYNLLLTRLPVPEGRPSGS